MKALLLTMLLAGCAHQAESVLSCAPSNYDICAEKCADAGRGQAFVMENAKDVACYCAKPPDKT